MIKGRGQSLIVRRRGPSDPRNRNGKERSSDSTTCDPLIIGNKQPKLGMIARTGRRSLEASRVPAIAALSPYRALLRVAGSLMRPCATGLAHAACLMRTSGQPWYWWREQTHAGAPSIESSDLQRAPCKPRYEVSWSEGMRHANRGPYALKSG
jgi:hypothetical protein